jgi:iron complex transport system ATP-binding protein
MLAAKNLVVRAGAATILDDCSLELKPGELLGVIGPNGAGKSTLVAALAGLRQASAGTVWLNEQPLTALSARERAQRIAYLPQLSEVSWPICVERLVELGRLPHLELRARMNEIDHAAVVRALEITGMLPMRARIVSTLSGGERARALLARALATQSAYLVVDEPAAHLDPRYQRSVFACLQAAAQTGTGVIVVLHDLSLALQFCDSLVLMHGGKVTADGLPDEVINAPRTRDAFSLRPLRVQAQTGETGVLWSS